ncbi:MAG: HAD-IIA family hydrolase [Magnetococcales bacterium]|nr:HAD-IIA family hydrolase [Magnetococcales bacterium]
MKIIEKPVINNPESLTHYYAAYRKALCEQRPQLSEILINGEARFVKKFSELSEQFDLILFDAFGVLNRGSEIIDGAAETIQFLQKKQKPFLVVSNNASQSPIKLEKRFADIGMSIPESTIIASGMTVQPYVAQSELKGRPYLLIGTDDSRNFYAPDPEKLMVGAGDNGLKWSDAEYIIACSNRDYYATEQGDQVEYLVKQKGVPVLLANPDMIAPGEGDSVYAVMGYTVSILAEQATFPIIGLGKPYPAIFELATARFPDIHPERILMVGDTLDTDILGGSAMGFKTCLTLSGVYAGKKDQLENLYQVRGIRPDYVVDSIAG